jgi:hypothetical protein
MNNNKTIWHRFSEFRHRIQLEGRRKHLARLHRDLIHVNERLLHLEAARNDIEQDIAVARVAFRAAQLPRAMEQAA